jgi:RHS repeat-associated protein
MQYDLQQMPSVAPTPLPSIGLPSVVSRKMQGSAGSFDIPLPLAGDSGIESRSGGENNEYSLVATFSQAVSLDGAKVISGTGEIVDVSSTGTLSGGTEVLITLANVSDAQVLSILLVGVTDDEDSADITIPMRVLVGDVNGAGTVSGDELSRVESQAGSLIDAGNFRCDVDANGIIDEADAEAVKANASNEVPTLISAQKAVFYEYDGDARVKRIYVWPGGDNQYDFSQDYDDMGRLKTIYRTGHTNPIPFEYTYDPASNVTLLTCRLPQSQNVFLNYSVDALNRISHMSVDRPGGQFTSEWYGYDMMNRLQSVYRDEEPNVIDSFGYLLDGELVWAVYGMPTNQEMVLDGSGLPEAPGPDSPSTMHTIRYNLDYAGNRVDTGSPGVLEYYGDVPTQYHYSTNAMNQYNGIAHGSQIINGSEHEISSYQGVNYNYLNDTHLAQVTASSGMFGTTLNLGYDALGRRVTAELNGVVTYYFYDGERDIEETDGQGNFLGRSVYGRGIDDILSRNNNNVGQILIKDHEGSVIGVLGTDGSTKERYRYDAFGKPTMYDGHGNVIQNGQSLVNNRFLFTGREYQSKFGFYEYRARAYHPTLGRFMSEDPNLFVRRNGIIKPMPDGGGAKNDENKWTFSIHPDEAEWNLFRYCNNDPWDLTDPMGLDPIGSFVGGVIGGLVFGQIGGEVGVALGATTGLVAGVETGPGEVVTIPVGGIAGGVAGAAYGTTKGQELGSYVGDKVGDKVKEIVAHMAGHRKGARQSTRGRHEAGDARRRRDQHGGERGDSRRDPATDRRGKIIKPPPQTPPRD